MTSPHPRRFYLEIWQTQKLGSDRLFFYCWKKLSESYFDADTDEEMLSALESYASLAVNNSRSSFYIKGE